MHSLQRQSLLTLVFVTLLLLAPRASAQDGNVQLESESTRIDLILRQMSDFLTSAQSFGFTAHEVMDEMEEGRRIQYSNSRSVVVRRPNHVATEASGDLVNRSVWYDGKSFTLLDREFNNRPNLLARGSGDGNFIDVENQWGGRAPVEALP